MQQLQQAKTWASRALFTSLLFFELTTGLPLRASDDTVIEGMSLVVTGQAAQTSTSNGKSWRQLEEEMQRFIGRLRTDQSLRDQLIAEGANPIDIAKKNGFEIDASQIVVQAMLNTDVEYMDKLELDNDLAMHFSMNPDIKPGSRLFYAHYLSENAKPFETRVHYYLVTEMTEEPCCSWNWTIGPVGAKSFKK